MYYCRPVVRCPSVVRAARNASVWPAPFFHPRPALSGNDFAPFLRMLDDFATPLAPAYAQHARQTLAASLGFPSFSPSQATFTPRFDVREVGANYELRGDVPGFEASDLDIEFADAETLIIRGRTESHSSSSTPADVTRAIIADNATPTESESKPSQTDNDDAASTYSTGSYQKPSVEEADVEAHSARDAPESSSAAQARASPAKEAEQVDADPTQERDQSRYWFQERHTGSFQRVFKFESKIDQDAVRASLKNGILSIVAPKAAAPAARKINVE